MEGLVDGMTQIAVSNVGVEFGATTLFTDISFTVAAGGSTATTKSVRVVREATRRG